MRRCLFTSLPLLLGLLAGGCGGAHAATGAHAAEPGEPDWVRTGDDALAGRMRELAAGMREAGLRVGPLWGTGFLAMRETATVPLDVPPGRCFSVVAMASSGVGDLDVTLYTPDGDVLAEDVQPDAHPTVQVCGGETGKRLYYYMTSYDGAGAYLFASFEGERDSFARAARVVGGRPGVAFEGMDAAQANVLLRELSMGLERRGFEPVAEPEEVPLAAGQRVRVPLPVAAFRCYTASAFAGAGLEALRVRVLDELGAEVARDASDSRSLAVQLCTDREADFALELHAVRGAGRVRLAIFAGAEDTVGGSSGLWLGQRTYAMRSSRSLEETLAAGRTRAEDGGYGSGRIRARGELAQAEAVAHRVGLEAGRCHLVTVAGGRGIARLAMRVADADTGVTLGTQAASGPAAAVRLCSAEGRRVRVEIVARAGGGRYALTTFAKVPPNELPKDLPEAAQGQMLAALEQAHAEGWTLASPPKLETLPFERTLPVACQRIEAIALGLDGSLDLRLTRGHRTLAEDAGPAVSIRHCKTEGRDAEKAPTLHVGSRAARAKAYVVRWTR